MINKMTIEKLDIDLSGRDLLVALAEVEKAGVSLAGYRVVKYIEGVQRLTLQKIKEEKIQKPDLIFQANRTAAPKGDQHDGGWLAPKAGSKPGEW